MQKVVIAGAVRTPIGAIGGGLSGLQARELATIAIRALLDRSGVDADLVDDTCLGWVMQDPRSPNIAKTAADLGLEPLAELKTFANVGVAREYMGEGGFKVVPPLLVRAGLEIGEIDLFEINEAFAAVLAAAFHDLPGLPRDRVTLWGSGVSLGHPVGCTGARQIVDMTHQLRRRSKHIGLTTRCVWGGIGSGEVLAAL